ncbi:hypothetical protein [Mucilaginibacter arboris]
MDQTNFHLSEYVKNQALKEANE